MVYQSGVVFSLTGEAGQGDFPYPLPPCTIDISFPQAFAPCQESSIQVNWMSDCGWTQVVFSFGVIGSGLLSFGGTVWPVQGILQEPDFLVFQPTAPNVTPNVPVNDFNGNPVTWDSLMLSGYYLRVSFYPGEWNAFVMNGLVPAWLGNGNVPQAFAGVPKVLGMEFVGATGGDAVAFTQGQMTTVFAGDQGHDAQGNLIEPYPFRVLSGGSPSFQYVSGGVVTMYANETGESSNLTQSLSGITTYITMTTMVA